MDWKNGLPELTLQKVLTHQEICLNTAVGEHNGRSLISLDMGKGKTLIGCVLAHTYHKTHSLIVVPANKVADWKRDFKLWVGYDLVELKKERGGPPHGITVCSVNVARAWLTFRFSFDCVVVDEAHCLKSPTALQTKRLLPICKEAKSLFLLTGTPSLNRPSELFSLVHALHPLSFPSRDKWINEFSEGYMDPRFPGSKSAFRETGIKSGMEDILASVMARLMCRPEASFTLPPLSRSLVVKTNELFSKELAELKEEARAIAQRQRDAVTTEEYECATFELKAHAMHRWREVGKFKAQIFKPWLKYLVEVDHRDQGVVIFTCQVDVAKEVHEFLPGSSLTTGETASRDQNIADLASGKTRVGVCTLGACGVGINMTPGVSVIIFLELPHVPALISQGEARAARLGQIRDVSSYWCALQGSQDEAILRGIASKQVAVTRAMGEEMQFLFHKTCGYESLAEYVNNLPRY